MAKASVPRLRRRVDGAVRGADVQLHQATGQRGRFGFSPGCLVWSLLLSAGLTVLLNVLIRLF